MWPDVLGLSLLGPLLEGAHALKEGPTHSISHSIIIIVVVVVVVLLVYQIQVIGFQSI